MASITASGVPVKYPEFGDIKIRIDGDDKEIESAEYLSKKGGSWSNDPEVKRAFKMDMLHGPSYPLCAEPFTMRCALFVLFEWFGEAESCWVEEPKHVKLEGEIEPMESVPGRVY